jgi:predicted dehydrogenase
MTTKDKSEQISRRDVTAGSVAAGVGSLISGATATATAAPRKKRYAIVGVGWRALMFQEAIHKTYAEHAELVACCDVNPGRLKVAQDNAKTNNRPEPKAYKASEFDRMVSETKPDVVIVTSVDATHDTYINWAMSLGCDVITEKPMTTDALKCQQIIDARKKFGRKIRVAFNYRYTPVRSQVKELLMGGLIGDVLSVDFNWVLDISHGADYFRRWHSQKKNSGGLMVHKATHHFDLVNWWLSAMPVTVRAQGKREFYTPKMAKRLGLNSHHERCKTCPEKAKCGFELDLAKNAKFKSLYLEQEQHDGYFRDRCVFRPEIDIEDTMNVEVAYDTGAMLSYSLNAFCSWEGYVVSFNGTKGRLEHKMEESVSLSGDGVPGAIKADGTYIRVYPFRKGAYQVEPRQGEGGHGGGDKVMLADLFAPHPPPDKLLRAADERSGAYSILTGVAANQSIITGQTVKIADLVKNIGAPTYAKSVTGQLSMPAKA